MIKLFDDAKHLEEKDAEKPAIQKSQTNWCKPIVALVCLGLISYSHKPAIYSRNSSHSTNTSSNAEYKKPTGNIENASAINLDKLMKDKSTEFLASMENSSIEYFILVDKSIQKASVYKITVEKIHESKTSTGIVTGDKTRRFDKKTPNGIYKIVSVENSSNWIHYGRPGAYGNFFSRLDAGEWDSKGKFHPNARSSIGIHGTSRPELLGSRASEGCIRLANEINDFYANSGILKTGTYVSILEESAQQVRK